VINYKPGKLLKKKISIDWIIVLILSGAFLLRVIGIFSEAARGYHPDEGKYILMALKFGKEGLNPHYFVNPSLFSYLLFFLYIFQFILLYLFSVIHSPFEYLRYYLSHPGIFLIEARFLSVLFGILTVYCAYLIGKIALNKQAGYGSGLLCAVTFLMVRESHFAVPDALATGLLSLSVVLYLSYLQNKKNFFFYSSALILGISITAKYTTAIMAFPLLLNIAIQVPEERKGYQDILKKGIIFISAMLIGFFIGCPFAFISWKEFLSGMGELAFFSQHGWFGIDYQINGLLFYLDTLRWGMGIGSCLFILFAIPTALFIEKKPQVLILAWFVLAYLIFISISQLRFERFILPILPFICVLISWFIFKLAEHKPYSKFIFYALLSVAAIPTFISSVYFDYIYSQQDTRTEALEWASSQLPPDSKIVMDGYCIPFPSNKGVLSAMKGMNTKEQFEVSDLGRFGLAIEPLEAYRKSGYDYLITSSFTYGKYSGFDSLFNQEIASYQRFPNELIEIKSFSPFKGKVEVPFHNSWIQGPGKYLYSLKQPGPVIHIYKFKK
jgi:4-amino-4-deoxy-L-arabinose transferase-like glycosyltransferase